MTVKELIEELQKHDEDTPVAVCGEGTDGYDFFVEAEGECIFFVAPELFDEENMPIRGY